MNIINLSTQKESPGGGTLEENEKLRELEMTELAARQLAGHRRSSQRHDHEGCQHGKTLASVEKDWWRGQNAFCMMLLCLLMFLWIWVVNSAWSETYEPIRRSLIRTGLQYVVQGISFYALGCCLESVISFQAYAAATNGLDAGSLLGVGSGAWGCTISLWRQFSALRRASHGEAEAPRGTGYFRYFLSLQSLALVAGIVVLVASQAATSEITQELELSREVGKINALDPEEGLNLAIKARALGLDEEVRDYENMQRFKHWTVLRRQTNLCVSNPTFYGDKDALTAGAIDALLDEGGYVGFTGVDLATLQTCVHCSPVIAQPSEQQEYNVGFAAGTNGTFLSHAHVGKAFDMYGAVPGYGKWRITCVVTAQIADGVGAVRFGDWIQTGPDTAYSGKYSPSWSEYMHTKMARIVEVLNTAQNGCSNPSVRKDDESRWSDQVRKQACDDRWTAFKLEWKAFFTRNGLVDTVAFQRRLQEFLANGIAAGLNYIIWSGEPQVKRLLKYKRMEFVVRKAGYIGGSFRSSPIFWTMVGALIVCAIANGFSQTSAHGLRLLCEEALSSTAGTLRSVAGDIAHAPEEAFHVCAEKANVVARLVLERLWFGAYGNHIGFGCTPAEQAIANELYCGDYASGIDFSDHPHSKVSIAARIAAL